MLLAIACAASGLIVHDLAEIDPVAQKMEQRATAEWLAAGRFARSGRAVLRDNALALDLGTAPAIGQRGAPSAKGLGMCGAGCARRRRRGSAVADDRAREHSRFLGCAAPQSRRIWRQRRLPGRCSTKMSIVGCCSALCDPCRRGSPLLAGTGGGLGWGAVAIAGACLAWGIDNNFNQSAKGGAFDFRCQAESSTAQQRHRTNKSRSPQRRIASISGQRCPSDILSAGLPVADQTVYPEVRDPNTEPVAAWPRCS